jgi:thiol-disulfide isomerase/thioredoxin
MHRRLYAAIALVLAALAAVAVLVAQGRDPSTIAGRVDPEDLPVGPEAPALRAEGWLNSRPLAARDLRGKVVVYDFWTYSCVNCVRTIPYIRSWFERYRRDGLVVVGVHSPEFGFEKSDANVAAAVKRLDVTWPVAFDDDLEIWRDFSTNYWPSKYVADRSGRVRYVHFGEGAYEETEDVLRKLLGVKPASPRATAPGTREAHVGTDITRETYLGTDRGPGDARIVGAWQRDGEKIVAAARGATVELPYRAREVNLVLAPAPAGPVDVLVELDGAPLPPAYRTPQIRVDAEGRTFVRVDVPDMYRLVLGRAIEDHTLRLTAQGPDLQAFAFTFGA